MKILKNLTIRTEDVLSSYSGKLGCMCGCNGKYSYNSQNRDLASKDRGYAVGDDDINDNSVKRMVNKFNKLEEVLVDVNKDGSISDYVFIETETRINCIYLKKGTIPYIKI